MVFELDMSFDASFLRDDTQREKLRVLNIIAVELQKVLQSRGRSLWAKDTRFSLRRFIVEEEGQYITVRNTAPYAPYVEAGIPAARTRGGARRTVVKYWDNVLRTATRDRPA